MGTSEVDHGNGVGRHMCWVFSKCVAAGPAPKEPLISEHKPTSQSSTTHGGNSERAVDGNTAQAWDGGSCTHTARQNAWWKVDLQGEYAVSSVEVWNRSD